jgi:hypothetical protein
MILRELNQRHERGEQDYTRPASIHGFTAQPSKYQAAVNTLLQERLINGTKDADGKLAIGLNTHRLADVKKELRPLYARAPVWLAVLVVAGLVAAGFIL